MVGFATHTLIRCYAVVPPPAFSRNQDPQETMLHGGKGKAEDKVAAMQAAGIAVADSPASLGTTLSKVLGRG